MILSLRLLSPLLIAAAFAGSALAAEPEAVVTAQGSGAPPSVTEQIDNYLKTSPAAELPRETASGVTPGSEPRKVHGVVDVSVGSGGYRSAYVASEIPIGKTGAASIAVGETNFGNRFGGSRFAPYASQSLGLGLRFSNTASAPNDCRPRLTGEPGPDLGVEDERPHLCLATEGRPPQ
ncbi:hypothetical protein [Phenylobacterium sp.]|jgi:hypothetical protein|uniref:hypothetical protein n=1 Tax=Phenylobacterium sp. TaxID=1871053 RepID=UPI002F429823